jgi:hypothetical protein
MYFCAVASSFHLISACKRYRGHAFVGVVAGGSRPQATWIDTTREVSFVGCGLYSSVDR